MSRITKVPRSLQASDLTGKIVKSFNTWAYKREQPSDLPLLERVIERAVLQDKPLEFVLYWGKGPRVTVGTPDEHCLDFLDSMCRRIGAVFDPGATVTLLLTDSHALLNGHRPEDVQSYFDAVTAEAEARNFKCFWLGDIKRLCLGGDPSERFVSIPPALQEDLGQSAAKWYRGSQTPSEAAEAYFSMNMQEKRAVERRFPQSIFITFNSSSHRCLFPDSLPIFYMYSLRKGFAEKPWFVSEATWAQRCGQDAHAVPLT